MSLAAEKPHHATLADLLAIPEEERFHEIIDGELVRKAMPSPRHGGAQRKLAEKIGPYQRRPGPPGTPGGWWFVTEVEVEFEPRHVYRPDVAGWRRERLAVLPEETPVRVVPDWVCEILSPSNARNDLVRKKRVYHRCKVPHYWLLDPMNETLSVQRWTQDGYTEVLCGVRGEKVRAEPFDAVELAVGAFFGDDDDE